MILLLLKLDFIRKNPCAPNSISRTFGVFGELPFANKKFVYFLTDHKPYNTYS